MKTSKILVWLVICIGVLAFGAAGAGVLWQSPGAHYPFTTLRGESVSIQGSGLYQFDTVSNASQAIAQDVVTLFLGIPLLFASLWFYHRHLLRGQLLLCGTLAYFLYTYGSYAMLVSFNSLFLLYVALFSLSLFAFILSITAIDVATIPAHFSNKLPRKSIGVFLFVLASFLVMAWLGRIVPALLNGKPPVGLENSTTLVIQVLDLGLLVPLCYLGGVLLLKRLPWGYLLASIVLFKGFTMGTAICAMIIGQLLAGVEVSPVEAIVFPLITVVMVVLTFILLKNINEGANDRHRELVLSK
jgi:hypothetical protein